MKMTRTDNNHMPLQAGEVLEYARPSLNLAAWFRLILAAAIGVLGLVSTIILIGSLA